MTYCTFVPDLPTTEAPAPSAGAAQLRLTRASAVRSRPVVWVVEGSVPLGNTTLVAGPAGLAKTTLLCDWAARITRGQMPGAFRGIPKDAVLVTGEDSIASTLKPRCEAAGADLDRLHFVEFGDEGFSIPGDLESMLAVLSTAPEAVFFGVDPLMAFVEDRIDSHKDHHIRRAFSALKRFAEDAGLAVVVISHLNKSESRDFLSRVAGSVGIGAAVRAGFAVVERPDSSPDDRERLLVHVKSNLGPYQPTQRFRVESRITRTYEGEDLPTSGLGVDESVTRSNVLADPEERTERDEAADWLRAYLADGPQPAENLIKAAKAAGFAEKTLRRAKVEIGVISNPDRDPTGRRVSGWTWQASSLDGHDKRLSGGHLENREETAGQPLSAEPPDGLDGHMATPGHLETSPPAERPPRDITEAIANIMEAFPDGEILASRREVDDAILEHFGGFLHLLNIAWRNAYGFIPRSRDEMPAAKLRALVAERKAGKGSRDG